MKIYSLGHAGFFIETGTHAGDMLSIVSENVSHSYSIELSERYYNIAKNRFINKENIFLLHGDSREKISEVLLRIDNKALFYLDSHHSGGDTAGDYLNNETPLIYELEKIVGSSNCKNFGSVIVIDDIRFLSTRTWPTEKDIEDVVNASGISYSKTVIDDMMILVLESKK